MSSKRLANQNFGPALLIGVLLGAYGCDSSSSTVAPDMEAENDKLLIIGQDLGAIRGYMSSGCCAQPDGLTAYIDFYDILLDDDFGGLGINREGVDAGIEFEWGSGPMSAYRTAKEFGVPDLAIGMSITENEHPGELQNLVAGLHDDKIRHLATFIKLVDGTVYLRIGYEFDGAWNNGYWDTENYIAAFRRVTDVLRDEGVTNFKTVWQASTSTTDDVIDGGHEDIRQWYPGDDYVDWMGVSWFMNPHATTSVASSFKPLTPLELTNELLEFARERGKPVMIAEASPQGLDLLENFKANHVGLWDGPAGEGKIDMSNDEIWDYWFGPLFDLLDENSDVIHSLAYINADWDSQPMWGAPYPAGFWGDSRLEVNSELAERFNAAIAAWKSQP